MSASAADQPRLHVVANRLPVSWSRSYGWSRAPGGLVTALAAYVRRHPVSWFGSSASLGDTRAAAPTWRFGPVHEVRVDADIERRAVRGVANSALWPALHGMSGRVRWRDNWWHGYVEHNRRFAEAVATTASDGDLVWVHDYHLFLVAAMLAEQRPDLVVGLSVHTPVDTAAIRGLPCASELFAALRAPSVIGLQTESDRGHLVELLESPSNVIGDGVLFVSPVSIDPQALVETAGERATQTLVERFRGRLGRRLLIVGIDRLDYTKAIVERLSALDQAFRRGLIRPDDVEIVQIAQPSRTNLDVYRDLRLEVERRAHELVSNWLRADGSSPLRLLTEQSDRRHVAALMSAADIALVTPIRDGMNLVAKEYSIYNEQRGGVLVLSAGAGAVNELGDGSVIVDGGDPTSVADGIGRAVNLDAPTRRDMALRRADAVRAWTSEDWAADFLRHLRSPTPPITSGVRPPM